MAEDQALDKI